MTASYIFSLLLCIVMGHLDYGTAPQIGRIQYLNKQVLFSPCSIDHTAMATVLKPTREKKTVLRSQRQPKSLRFFSPRGQENPKQEAEQNQQQPLTSQRAEQYGAAAHLQSSSGCRKRGVCFTKSSPMMNCDTASPAAQTLEELLILTQDYFHKTVP